MPISWCLFLIKSSRFTAILPGSSALPITQNSRFSLPRFAWPLLFYFSAKKSGIAVAKQKIGLLVSKLSITNIGKPAVEQAITNKKVHDVEDGMQYYAALESKCTAIITQDSSDYNYASIDVLDAAAFLEKYVLK